MLHAEQLSACIRHLLSMARPTFLVAEPEPAQALSTRKLVLETAKFNVITAHSGGEALELAQRFPNVDALVIHSGLPDLPSAEAINNVKRENPRLIIVLLSAGLGSDPRYGDHTLSSHEPHDLLTLMRDTFGDPRVSREERRLA